MAKYIIHEILPNVCGNTAVAFPSPYSTEELASYWASKWNAEAEEIGYDGRFIVRPQGVSPFTEWR